MDHDVQKYIQMKISVYTYEQIKNIYQYLKCRKMSKDIEICQKIYKKFKTFHQTI